MGLPRRWVVERSIAWLKRNRRLSKDYERKPAASDAMVYIAGIRLLAKRLAAHQWFEDTLWVSPPRHLPNRV